MKSLRCHVPTLQRALLIALTVAFSIPIVSNSQTPASTPTMPTDAKGLIALVGQTNDLIGSNLQPWHLKASYKLLDQQGKSAGEGTVEEFWAAHRKRRIIYTGQNFTQTTYWTDAGILQSGPATLPSYLIEQLRAYLVEPLPPAAFLDTQTFTLKDRDFGSTKLQCAIAKVAPPPDEHFGKSLGPTFCINTDKPVLRVNISALGARQVLRNSVVAFQGHYIPRTCESL